MKYNNLTLFLFLIIGIFLLPSCEVCTNCIITDNIDGSVIDEKNYCGSSQQIKDLEIIEEEVAAEVGATAICTRE